MAGASSSWSCVHRSLRAEPEILEQQRRQGSASGLFPLIVQIIGELGHFLRRDAQRTSGVGADCGNYIGVDVVDQPLGFFLGFAGGLADVATHAFAEVFPGLFRFRFGHISPPLRGLPGRSIITVAIQGGQFEQQQGEPELPCGLERGQRKFQSAHVDDFCLRRARSTRRCGRCEIARVYTGPVEQLARTYPQCGDWGRDQADDAGKYEGGPEDPIAIVIAQHNPLLFETFRLPVTWTTFVPGR